MSNIGKSNYNLAIQEKTMKSMNIGAIAAVAAILCATPGYLKRHGTPKHPADLASHAIIAYSLWSMQDVWAFEGPEGTVGVRTVPCARCSVPVRAATCISSTPRCARVRRSSPRRC